MHAAPSGDDPQSSAPPFRFPSPVNVVESVLVVVGGPLKFAVTMGDVPSTGTTQDGPTGVVGQSIHESNAQLSGGVALSVTAPPPENATWQLVAPFPQLIPPGSLVIVPLPITSIVTGETASVPPSAFAITSSIPATSADAATSRSAHPEGGCRGNFMSGSVTPGSTIQIRGCADRHAEKWSNLVWKLP